MARCEDFPCCGHEMGCCPDFNESGQQLNMICTCGAKLPVNNRSSICDTCLEEDEDDRFDRFDDGEPYDIDEEGPNFDHYAGCDVFEYERDDDW